VTAPGTTPSPPAVITTTDSDVFSDVVGQPEAVAICRAAVAASRGEEGSAAAAMTHAWLFTGPPGSGRSVAARAFAAALECDFGGCGRCQACHTVLAGTHADVRTVAPEGLTIPVTEMRQVVQLAARRPSTGRWQIVLIEDADRLTESASNALLKAIEEPPDHTVFLLCAPSTHPDDVSVTIRSRCRVLGLVTPSAAAIADVLVHRDGIDRDTATWAASVAGGHVGRARALARNPESREHRLRVLAVPGMVRTLSDVFAEADDLLGVAKQQAAEQSARRDEAEMEELKIALGAGGTGKGAATALRGTAGVVRDLERRQKSRATRTERDVLDRALVDLSGFYRDVLVRTLEAGTALTNPDLSAEIETAAQRLGAEGALRRLDAVLACREALELNVKPQIALEALMVELRAG
jgi:DNA polymerase-3 subunit delta'